MIWAFSLESKNNKSAGKMEVEVIIIILFSAVVNSNVFSCGPDEKCLCETNNQMNCSKTKIPISEMCGYIGNITNYNVSVLYMARNDYQNIKQFSFKGCGQLLELYLGGNGISSIEKGSFGELNNLELLDLSCNNLTVYDETLKLNYQFPLTVKTLMLNGNLKEHASRKTLYPDLSYLSHLEVLYMDGLRDKIFPESYRKIQTLQTVILSGFNGNCNISHITNFTLESLAYLRTLNMSLCNITSIHAGAFKSLSSLEILDLSHNLRLGFRMLRNISYSLQFTNIKIFNYSKVHSTFGIGTQLKKQDLCYLWNTTLTEMLISSNRIQLLETNVMILIPESLKIMRAEDNKYTFGPYLLQLGCLSNLEEFYGSYQNTAHSPILYEREPNEIFSEVTIDDSSCPYMQNNFLRNISIRRKNCPYFQNDKIDMKTNWPRFPEKLRRAEFAKSNMQYSLTPFPIFPPAEFLEYLDVSGNILHSWIGPIGPFLKLKYLNLSRNYCSHIGLNFFNFNRDIENLQLQENFLGLVLSDDNYGPYIFDKLVNVTVLNLSSNIISYLPPKVFATMSKLEVLDLSVNSIETWTIDVSTLNSLLHLILKFNFLHTLPSVLRNKLESNSEKLGTQFTIDLRNNTITTYCEEKEYLKWMVQRRNSMLYFDEYIFQDSQGATVSVEQFVKNVNNLDKECRSYTIILVLTSIGISVFLAILVGGIIYKNRWKLRYLIRVMKIKRYGYTNLHDNLDDPEQFMYDAFISYANENLRFILDKIIPNLEELDMALCLHDKTFLPGNDIADNIVDAIRKSRKTVVILSKDFLKRKWCLYEFNMARMESIYTRNGNNCLVVVMLEDVPARHMSAELLDWIQSNTYIEYTTEQQGELLFWENLKEALN